MPRGRVPTTSWARGEIDPLAEGRVDLDQYYHFARHLLNLSVRETGPVQRRAGTRHVGLTKFPQAFSPKLVAFRFSETDVYVLEFGEGYIWVYRDGARIASVDIATPYLIVDLPLLRFEQSNDVLYIACQFYQPRVLERYSDVDWRLKTFPVTGIPAAFEYGTRPQDDLNPGATTGTGVTFTTDAAEFLTSDAGRHIQVFAGANAGGEAHILTVNSPSNVTVDIVAPFTNTSQIAPTDWKIEGSPLTACTPSAAGPVFGPVTLTLASPGWRSDDVGKYVFINGGTVLIEVVTSDTVATGIILAELSSTEAASLWLLEETAWSSFNGFPGAVAFGPGDRLFWASSLAQPVTVWASAVGDYEMYAAGSLDDEAFEFALNTREANRIVWLSSGRDLIAGTLGVAIPIRTANNAPMTPSNPPAAFAESRYGVSPIVSPLRVGSFVIFPSRSGRRLRQLVYRYEDDAYRAPDLLQLAGHLTRGASPVNTPLTIRDVAYQEELQSTLWVVREDGLALTCTFLPYENVVAWSRFGTDGLVRSVVVIPHPDGDREQVWLIVVRVVGGQPEHHVEVVNDSTFVYDRMHTDDGVRYDFTITVGACSFAAVEGVDVPFFSAVNPFSPGNVGMQIRNLVGPGYGTITAFVDPSTVLCEIVSPWQSLAVMQPGEWAVCPLTFAGLTWLEGALVDIQGDGSAYPPQVVTGGMVSIQTSAVKVEIGRHYPALLTTVRPGQLEAALEKRLGEILVRLEETLGCTINSEVLTFRSTSDPLDVHPPLFSGDKKITKLGIENEGRIFVSQDQPLPLTVLYVSGLYQTGA